MHFGTLPRILLNFSRDVAYKLVNERKMLTEVGGALPSPRQAPMPGLRTSVIQVVVTQVRKILEAYVSTLRWIIF